MIQLEKIPLGIVDDACELFAPFTNSRSKLFLDWQRKVEHRTARKVRGHPEPSSMRFDNGAGDCQAHAHAVCFCRIEVIEQLICRLRIKTGARISYRDAYVLRVS